MVEGPALPLGSCKADVPGERQLSPRDTAHCSQGSCRVMQGSASPTSQAALQAVETLGDTATPAACQAVTRQVTTSSKSREWSILHPPAGPGCRQGSTEPHQQGTSSPGSGMVK